MVKAPPDRHCGNRAASVSVPETRKALTAVFAKSADEVYPCGDSRLAIGEMRMPDAGLEPELAIAQDLCRMRLVLGRVERRRRFSVEQKLAVLAEAMEHFGSRAKARQKIDTRSLIADRRPW